MMMCLLATEKELIKMELLNGFSQFPQLVHHGKTVQEAFPAMRARYHSSACVRERERMVCSAGAVIGRDLKILQQFLSPYTICIASL